MEKRGKTDIHSDRTDDDYVTLSEVARMHGLSVATIRRRILEGDTFPGAKKVPAPSLGAGEIWLVPRSEVESVSLEQVSPRTYYGRPINKHEPYGEDVSVSSTSVRALEARVSALEQHMLRLLDRISNP